MLVAAAFCHDQNKYSFLVKGKATCVMVLKKSGTYVNVTNCSMEAIAHRQMKVRRVRRPINQYINGKLLARATQ